LNSTAGAIRVRTGPGERIAAARRVRAQPALRRLENAPAHRRGPGVRRGAFVIDRTPRRLHP